MPEPTVQGSSGHGHGIPISVEELLVRLFEAALQYEGHHAQTEVPLECLLQCSVADSRRSGDVADRKGFRQITHNEADRIVHIGWQGLSKTLNRHRSLFHWSSLMGGIRVNAVARIPLHANRCA